MAALPSPLIELPEVPLRAVIEHLAPNLARAMRGQHPPHFATSDWCDSAQVARKHAALVRLAPRSLGGELLRRV